MVTGQHGDAFRQVRTLFSVGTVGELTDGQLLERFTADRGAPGEAAFAELLERHGPMVLRTCRSILGDDHEAQDAFQATFLVLLRRADSLWVRDSLGPWLHGVASRVASSARSAAVRQRSHERRAAGKLRAALVHDAIGDDHDLDLGAALQEEIERLPTRYRAALVLCYLEGLTHEQAARQLAWPVGTVRSRLARGRERLRGRLVRRGLAPSAGLLGVIHSSGKAQAALPATLAGSTIQAAMRLAAGETLAGIVPARVLSLVAEVSKSMGLTRITTATSLFVMASVTVLGMAALAGQAPQGDRPSAAREARGSKAAENAKDGEKREGTPRELSVDAFPPVVVKTIPAPGSTGVDPSLGEIRATFNKPMSDGSWSWVQISRETFPETNGKIHYEPDKQTCVMPVKLKAGKTYVIWINAERFQNFRDAAGNPAVPYLLVFQTREP